MYMGLGESQIQMDFKKKEAEKQREADFWNSIISGAGTAAGMMYNPVGTTTQKLGSAGYKAGVKDYMDFDKFALSQGIG